MKRYVLVLCIMLASVSSGQTARKAQPKAASSPNAGPLPLATVIEVEAFSRTSWELAFAYKDAKYKPKNGDEAAGDLEKWASETLASDEPPRLAAEHALIARNRAEFETLVKVSRAPLLYTQTPVRLASKEGALTLLLTSLGSQNVYNILRLDAKQRAAKEIESTVLPGIKQFQVINSPAIKNYGVIAIFGSKDFSDADSSPKAEVVALVAPATVCRKLADAEITEEEFVALSDVYIVDRDQLTDEVRKVKVSLGRE